MSDAHDPTSPEAPVPQADSSSSDSAQAAQASPAVAPLPHRAWASALVWSLRILGLAAFAGCIFAILLLQGSDPRLLRWSVPAAALLGVLGAAAAAAIAALVLRRPLPHILSLCLIALAASGVHDITAADWRLAALLACFLLAAELPDGATRLARLHGAIRVSRKSPAGRDLRVYGLHYAVLAPVTLLVLAAIAVAALRAPELAMSSLGLKYQEALETRSVFFVVAVCWLMLAPAFLLRALAGMRRVATAPSTRPASPVATGALKVEATASSSSEPLIEVTQ